ncbi:hypothetical protein D1F64_07845 [Breoghania sp. L-A4]|nr:hypothetical protein D1F64_07845 [Breoghania sp. L-A4]
MCVARAQRAATVACNVYRSMILVDLSLPTATFGIPARPPCGSVLSGASVSIARPASTNIVSPPSRRHPAQATGRCEAGRVCEQAHRQLKKELGLDHRGGDRGAAFDAMPREKEFADRLHTSLGDARSYEETLDRMRIFAQEQQFLIGVRLLGDALAVGRAGRAYARLAEVVVRDLLEAAKQHLAEAHGAVEGGQVVVLAMGKLGSLEMTPTSDLDLIVLYDFPDDVTASEGPRPLSPSQYFIRLTQRLLAALSAPTAEGTLYEVDFRLRPSGNAGPLATRFAGFADYQREKAWTWEHMALTRARVIAGDADLWERTTAVIEDVLCAPRDIVALRRDVASMRARIEAEKGSTDRWALKEVAGGLVDVEFIGQYLQLANAAAHPEILAHASLDALTKAGEAGLLAADDAELLVRATRLYQGLMQILRLSVAGKFSAEAAPRGVLDLLARVSNEPDFSRLEAHLDETQAAVRAAFERIIGPVVRGAE